MYRNQPNKWSCGPTALYNAMQAAGSDVGLARVVRAGKPSKRWGADEVKLKATAKRFGFILRHWRCTSDTYARSGVRAHLKLGQPVLVSVDRDSSGPWIHWIAVVRCTAKHVWIADSERRNGSKGYSDPLEQLTWRAFLARALAVLGPKDFPYHFYSLARKANA